MGTPNWTVAKAKSKFSEIIERAISEGPQTITRRGRTAAVVVGAEEWQRKTKRSGNRRRNTLARETPTFCLIRRVHTPGPSRVNPATYLGGGRDFGPFGSKGELPHLYSRNLTPDKTGRPEGGHTFEEFLTILRTGKDYDHVHPNCTGAADGNCLLPPFNGEVLQVMPWPVHQNMTEHDIRAIYEYLSAIPCIDTDITGAPVLRNDCK